MANVKICGLQSVEVLKSILHLPIDYVGFVFAPSKRRVKKEQAAELISALRLASHADSGNMPKAVGVFVNPTQAVIAETLGTVPLDAIQMHGDETPDFCRQVREEHGVAVIKAFSIRDTGTEETSNKKDHSDLAICEKLDPYCGAIDILLIDTFDSQYGGGSGRKFRWELIPAYAQWAKSNGIKLFVAGGLQPDNVQKLLQQYEVDGVDVSSGVETEGVKDIDKIRTFVERVKHHEQLA